jgi:hypothetical protein
MLQNYSRLASVGSCVRRCHLVMDPRIPQLIVFHPVDGLEGRPRYHRSPSTGWKTISCGIRGSITRWQRRTQAEIRGKEIKPHGNIATRRASRGIGSPSDAEAVDLCSKTELLAPGEEAGVSRDTELSYCKVKLFRDHGAEQPHGNIATRRASRGIGSPSDAEAVD